MNFKQRGAMFQKLRSKMGGGMPMEPGFKKFQGVATAPPPMVPSANVTPPQHPMQHLAPVDATTFGPVSPAAHPIGTQYVGNGKQERFKKIKRIFGT